MHGQWSSTTMTVIYKIIIYFSSDQGFELNVQFHAEMFSRFASRLPNYCIAMPLSDAEWNG